ncbi:hypothetical protein B0H13DRAFT_1863622 [Mycena leptocephala]|nr:hypothetical protein B0H13DRAFT_1863622 [Mycena leptocephala]
MVGRALSNRVKQQKLRRRENFKLQNAIDEYMMEQQKEGGKRGLRPIALKHGVNFKTLSNLAKATHLELDRLGAPVIEHIPDQLRAPDWGVLKWNTALPNYTRDGLETRCETLERELADARKLLRAHEVISEGQNAQLIVQNIGMGKMKAALFEKEKGKNSDRTILFPGGKGRHLTADEVIVQKRALENAKAQEATDKATKKAKREAKKAEKERLEAEWRVMLEDHATAIEGWAGRCVQLKANGAKAKDLPKKPKSPLKPKPKDDDDEDDESGDESGGDGE